MDVYKKIIKPSVVTGVLFATILSGCGASDTTKSASNTDTTTTTSTSNTATTQNKQAASKNTSSKHAQQIKDIAALAKQGKVQGAEFVAGVSIIDDIHKSWGQPNEGVKAGDNYEKYSPGAGKGSFAFGIGRGEVVYDIRSFGSSMDDNTAFKQITMGEIKTTLGKPTAIRTNSGDDILVYSQGEYELKFVSPHATQRLDHISVYSPKAAKPMGG